MPAEDNKEAVEKYSIGLLLCIAYSASLGGTSTIIGTGPNLILKQQMKILFPDAPELSFLEWFLFGFPTAMAFLLLLWLLFCFMFVRQPEKIHFNANAFGDEYRKLGKIKHEEVSIVVVLVLMIILWFSRVGFGESTPGWGVLFKNMPGDGTVAMFCSFILFLIPSKKEGVQRVMDWDSLLYIPWGIILLLGSGFALAKAFHVSGLSEYIGEALSVFKHLPWFALLFVVCFMITFATELTSNVATANICLPILGSIAVNLGQNPLLLMLPATIACSYAFMLPVATPPNAIVFASGRLKVIHMIKIGFIVNIMAIILLPSLFCIIGLPVFGITIGSLPSWAQDND